MDKHSILEAIDRVLAGESEVVLGVGTGFKAGLFGKGPHLVLEDSRGDGCALLVLEDELETLACFFVELLKRRRGIVDDKQSDTKRGPARPRKEEEDSKTSL